MSSTSLKTLPEQGKKRYVLLGVVLLLICWQICAWATKSVLVASPIETFKALGTLPQSTDFALHFFQTIFRLLIGLGVGTFIGLLLGILAGLYNPLRLTLEPIRWTMMSVPPILIVVLVMFYMGMGTRMVIIFTALILWPVIYVHTVKGMMMVDQQLEEMSTLFRFPLRMKIRDLYIPALSAPLLGALIQIICNGMRIVVLAEVLGTTTGIGASFQTASTNLEMPTVFAWVLIIIFIVALLEFLILRPIETRMLHWKEGS